MRILLLAPEPFYQERGTPIAVDLVLRVLSSQGHEVDVLVYHEGTPVNYPGVKVHRIPQLPFTSRVRPGFSIKKLVCDYVFFFKALGLAFRTRYDLVHAVEESVFVALVIKAFRKTPYLYDMDSSMVEQILENFPAVGFMGGWLRAWEGAAIRHAAAVMPVCDALADIALRFNPKTVTVLRDISLLSLNNEALRDRSTVRQELGASTDPVVMYVGNLERYQGIDLFLESFAIAQSQVPKAQLVVIGGTPAAISRYQQKAQALGLRKAVCFVGPRPVSRLAEYLKAADVLVSPRLLGGNTPMKIYSYLDSGTAVIATDLPTHRQVMTDAVALLVEPTPQAMAAGLIQLLNDPQKRKALAAAAGELIRTKHSYSVFKATLAGVYDLLAQQRQQPGEAVLAMAGEKRHG